MNNLSMDFLYLDLSCCERFQSINETLEGVMMELREDLLVIDHLTGNFAHCG